ncbi:amino acid dehydrogenase [Endozoicomonas sp. Mp262]|uniref:Leu/Phe/Val dehydrogenase n=1 Tax=Endozoicomonas sp. Mp262 TaxID=2919499 RepID=UPI0021D9D40B
MFREITEARVNDLHCRYDEESGLQSIIAIHSTRRGPALGGCRIIPYNSSEEAVTDAIRLAKGMSYKAALAGLNLGGGKAVIMEPPQPYDRQRLFSAFGRFVEELNGRYITAMDSGTSVSDMDTINSQTRHVTCTSNSGNPAPHTAEGVFYGIQASLKAHPELADNLKGMRIAVQGLGNVGYALCQRLHQEGAKLFVSDIDDSKVSQCERAFKAVGVDTGDIHKTPCEIFSPCGLGGTLSEQTIGELQCAAVAGSANNQLLTPECGYTLYKKGVLYAPDYLINAGGLIFVAMSHQRRTEQELSRRVEAIHPTLLEIFRREQQSGEPSNIIADHMAEAILFDNSPDQLSA